MIRRIVSTDFVTVVCAVVQATLHRAAQDFLVLTQIVSGCRLNILMANQVLDQRNVRAVVAKVRTEGVAQYVRRQRLCDSHLASKIGEETMDIFPAKLPYGKASRYEKSRIVVSPAVEIRFYPRSAARGKEYGAATFPLSHDFRIARVHLKRLSRQGEGFGNAHPGRQKQLGQGAKTNSRKRVVIDSVEDKLNLLVVQVSGIGGLTPWQPDLSRVKAFDSKRRPREFQQAFETADYAVLASR